jgi:hypothetical protein
MGSFLVQTVLIRRLFTTEEEGTPTAAHGGITRDRAGSVTYTFFSVSRHFLAFSRLSPVHLL